MNDGWIKFHRKTLNSPLWQYAVSAKMPHLISFFCQLLLMVNYEEKKWYDGKQENYIPAGSLIASLQNLADDTGLTVRQVRIALQHYESMGMMTRKTTNKWTQVWIVNWAKYQISVNTNDKQDDKPMTNERQTNDKPMTTTKEYKNIRNKEEDIGFDEKPSNHQEVGQIVDKSRKDIKYPKAIIDDIVNYYVQKKSIAPQGNEWLPIQQTVKTMLMNGRTPEDIKECISWISTHWPSWDIRTVMVKMPEFLAGTLDKEKNKINPILTSPIFLRYKQIYHEDNDSAVRAKMSLLPQLESAFPLWKYGEQWKEAKQQLTEEIIVSIPPSSALNDMRQTLVKKFSYG